VVRGSEVRQGRPQGLAGGAGKGADLIVVWGANGMVQRRLG
jgi:hypothetical protein